jgi:hypothetical protein
MLLGCRRWKNRSSPGLGSRLGCCRYAAPSAHPKRLRKDSSRRLTCPGLCADIVGRATPKACANPFPLLPSALMPWTLNCRRWKRYPLCVPLCQDGCALLKELTRRTAPFPSLFPLLVWGGGDVGPAGGRREAVLYQHALWRLRSHRCGGRADSGAWVATLSRCLGCPHRPSFF